ncbi:multicopper oxidase domain-containing protein [Bradyrhizobium barranii]|nr:multicopper oxidase domain-containing protein [Bradyrhizobium barranii]WFT99921.1 multicopper oxidase domain-containing protein [Bradyrhizobium barranii]
MPSPTSYTISATVCTVAVRPTRTYGYSSPILGPVLRLRRGDRVQMIVHNAVHFPTTVHWHGLLVPGHSDGGPQQGINPGETWRPVLAVDQPAATLWYHPHPHHDTARQIYLGLAGLVIVDDGDDHGLPSVLVDPMAMDPSVAVQRRQFVLNNGICEQRTRMSEHPDMPALIGINGKVHDPKRIDVETRLGTTEIWEILSVGMPHPFHIHGAMFRILSLDGKPPPEHLAGLKDVVLVEDKAELLVSFTRPATREHPFMYHCHILEHEDAGMMGQYTCA